MKTRNMLWAALSMTAALVMTACSSDNDLTETPAAPQAKKTIPYTVTVSDDAAITRATVSDDPTNRQLYFATGDQLYITGTDIQGVLDLQAGDEGKATGATFSGELTYSGSGSPADDLSLTATLVSAQQNVGTQVSVDDAGAVTVNYPTAAYCATISDAVQQYSRLTATSTYGAHAFTLTQQTAFLNFEITVNGGSFGVTLPANVISNGSSIAKANVTTVNDGDAKAKFVLPVAVGTTLSGATVKLGGIEIGTAIGNATLSSGKVYNVMRTVDMSGISLADAFTDDAVVRVLVNTANYEFYGVTGTYDAKKYGYDIVDESYYRSLERYGEYFAAFISDYHEYLVTFNTTDNTYTESATSSDNPWRMTSLYCITINGVDITDQLTNATSAAPAETTVTWTTTEMNASFLVYDGWGNNNSHYGITVTASGSANWEANNIGVNGPMTFTFTSTVGNIKSIVITADDININELSAPTGWTINDPWDNPRTLSWNGTASATVNLPLSQGQNFSRISTIVFTLVE